MSLIPLTEVGSIILPGANLLKLLSGSKIDMDFTKLSYHLADYFQLRNDYVCLWSEDYNRTKGIPYEDITEGKFSYPIIYALNNSPKRVEILPTYHRIAAIGLRSEGLSGIPEALFAVAEILKQHTTDIKLKEFCVNLIEECGGRSYTLAKINEMYDNIVREIDALGSSPELKKLLETKIKLWEK